MLWDKDSVQQYLEWFSSEQGAFALCAEKQLVSYLMSGWPRRGHTLLEVGCGPAIMLELFWEAGLDVTGFDAAPEMLAAARERMGGKADFHLGDAEHLPFDDNQFDFVALLAVLEFVKDPVRAMEEACRVASRGIVLTMRNRWSWYYLSHGNRGRYAQKTPLQEATWFHPFAMRALVKKATGRKIMTMRSVLPGPYRTWRNRLPWAWLNGCILPYGLGAYAGIRVDLCNVPSVTPLGAKLCNRTRTAQEPLIGP